MAGEVRLLHSKLEPDAGLIELLRELLSQAESGQLRALACVEEYVDGAIDYDHAGDFNEFEFAGHAHALAQWLIEDAE